jgi:hypothetical protein
MWSAIIVLAGILMAGDLHVDEPSRVTVRGLNQRLQLTGWQATWPVDGEILPPLGTLPGGQLVAIMEHQPGSQRELVLWSKDGKQLGRAAVGLPGDILATRVLGSRLLTATATRVVEFDTRNLRTIRQREIAFAPTKKMIYGLGPSGFWVVTEQAILYFDLDGSGPMVRNRPLVPAPSKPPCPAAVPCSAGFQPQETEALVSESGELLVFDVFQEQYPYGKDPGQTDQVWPSTATILDARGNIVTQRSSSWMKTTREWLWSTRVSGNPGIFPNDWGFVRTRYTTTGLPLGRLFGSRGSDFLYWAGSMEIFVRRVDRRLNTLWKQDFQPLGKPIMSPSWASPILFHDSTCYEFSTISDQGHHKAEATINIEEIAEELSRTHFKRPRFAIGQSSEGDWLLIAY